MVAGHPFKGATIMSTGYLQHPDMKRFALNGSELFVPPNPAVWTTAMGIGAGAAQSAPIPAFGDFFATYFAGRSFNVTAPRCATMLEGMKKCWENHTEDDPVNTC